MDVREKLVELIDDFVYNVDLKHWYSEEKDEKLAEYLISHGVTAQGLCHKAESVISKTGLMCTACYSDIDRDAVFCKYCGAKVVPQPPKGE